MKLYLCLFTDFETENLKLENHVSKADIALLVAQAILKLWHSYSCFASPNAGVTDTSPCVRKLSPFNRYFNEPRVLTSQSFLSSMSAFRSLDCSYCMSGSLVEAQRRTCSSANTACDVNVSITFM